MTMTAKEHREEIIGCSFRVKNIADALHALLRLEEAKAGDASSDTASGLLCAIKDYAARIRDHADEIEQLDIAAEEAKAAA